jgi:NAD(P)-dependent dehydrogenase (short-subunit alcohol dehydrogenase family)
LTALGHADRTVLLAPARPANPGTRAVFVFSHPGAGKVTEIVSYTDGTDPDDATPEAAPAGATRPVAAAGRIEPCTDRVLVTASSDTLGFEIAHAFLRAGASVAFHGTRSELTVPAPAVGSRAAYLPADLADAEQSEQLVLDAAVALGGPITILINNLGPWDSTPLSQLSGPAWHTGLQVHMGAALRLAQLVAPGMREAGRGRIVNISAGSAYVRDHGLYGFAKGALGLMTETLAYELAPEVTVNAVAPGQIEESVEAMNAIDPTAVPAMLRGTPAGRFVTRAEVARAVVALCEPAFDMVTGVVLPLDGGYRIASTTRNRS